jgi:HlyD family secretion protein
LGKFMSKKAIKTVAFLVVIAIIGGGAYYAYKEFAATASASGFQQQNTAKVKRGDLNVTITGTGTLQPVSRYDIVPLVKGSIVSAPFEEGEKVEKGDLLYKIDDSDLMYSIEKAQNSVEKLKRRRNQLLGDLDNLVVYAPVSGRMINFDAKEGESLSSNSQIASIVDHNRIILTVPFHKSQINKIKVGQDAQIYVRDMMWYVDGKVRYISNAAKPVAGVAPVYDVEIIAENPGSFAEEENEDEGMEISGIIKTDSGNMYSASSGTIRYGTNEPVYVKAGGEVEQIYVKNGEWVEKGQKILSIKSDNIDETIFDNSLELKDAQLSLEETIKSLDDYSIESPIDGTVIEKYYKEGDTVDSTNSSVTLMTVADMSKMVFTLDVDELDIAKISLGQEAVVTADAIEGTVFTGKVTNIAMEGNSQNGVTTYPVEITISDPGNLKPGMNVNAEILVQSKKDVLYVPMAAVIKAGDKTYVTVKDNAVESPSASKVSHGSPQKGAAASGQQRVEVVVGINNEDYIEIVSGLSEGQEVFVQSTGSNIGSSNNFRGPGPGGMGGIVIRR